MSRNYYNGDCFVDDVLPVVIETSAVSPEQPKVNSYTVNTDWSQEEVIKLCTKLETFAPEFGFHIGFTGGSLYKVGRRKDADIIIYPHNDPKNVLNWAGFKERMEDMGIFIVSEHYGWLKKAKFGPFKCIDFFFMTRIAGQSRGPKQEYPVT